MKKGARKITAFLLAFIMMLTPVVNAGTISESFSSESVVKFLTKAVDKVVDVVIDVVGGALVKALFTADSMKGVIKDRAFPTVEEYKNTENEYFYEGTNGRIEGTGWKLGFASNSVIPVKWRLNAAGEQDDNGMCLNKSYYFGGYFTSTTDKIYDDERVNLAVLSAGTDENNNGVDDIIIIASIDNIGIASDLVKEIRKTAAQALAEKGVSNDDIISFEVTATHAHTVVEALGMSLDRIFLTALKNHFLLTKDTAVNKELRESICKNAADAAVKAYDKMENGRLCYFETENVNEYIKENGIKNENGEIGKIVRDKLGYGAACQEFFACYYFEGVSGEKTILANIGMHPTTVGRNSDKVSADVPHYMNLAMQEAGYNLVFIQSAQAAIGLSTLYTEEAKLWAEEKTLSREVWEERYGKEYTETRYGRNDDDWGEEEYFDAKASGYTLAHIIIESIDTSKAVAPTLNIKMTEALLPLDYSVMYIAAVTGCFGYDTVTYPEAESGYGVMTEIGYMCLGDDVAIVTLPGEISPAIVFGQAEDYEGEESWSGKTSWSGEEWTYRTVADMAKEALGEDKRIIAFGITNNEVGYVMPDTDTAKNFLTKSIFDERANNEELMSPSAVAGSSLIKGYGELFGVDVTK